MLAYSHCCFVADVNDGRVSHFFFSTSELAVVTNQVHDRAEGKMIPKK